MIQADFEYRLYEGKLVTQPLLLEAFGFVNIVLDGVKFNTLSPLRGQLEEGAQNVIDLLQPWVPDIANRVATFLNQVPSDLRLPPVHTKLMEGSFSAPNDPTGLTKIKIRVSLDGNWEIVLGSKTFSSIPGFASPFDAESNQLKIMVSLARMVLLNFDVDVEYKAAGKWRRLVKFRLQNGSKLSGVHARLPIEPAVDPAAYELVPGSGQKFRPVTFRLTGVGLSSDDTDLNTGEPIHDWIMDGLNYVATHTYGGLDFYQAIANRLLHWVEEELPTELPFEMPPLVDFPAEAVYGEAFGVAPTDRTTILYRPQIDIIGPVDKNKPRTIIFRNLETGGRGPIDPGDLFDPDRFSDWADRLIDSINVNEIIGFDPRIIIRIPLPYPTVNTAALIRSSITKAVRELARPIFLPRDLSIMNLLKDGISAAVLSGLRWRQIDFAKQAIRIKVGRQTTSYKIGPESMRALRQLQKQRSPAPRPTGRRALEQDKLVFVTPRGWPLGQPGIISLWKAYETLIDLAGKLGGFDVSEDAPPLPESIPPAMEQNFGALGYAVNVVVPNLQFGFLHAVGGLNLSQSGLLSADFTDVYPALAGAPSFGVSISTPPQAPLVNLSTNGAPRLEFIDLPIQFLLEGGGQQPLQARFNVIAELQPCFLKCHDCVRGKDASFLALLRNLVCLAELGLIEIKGSIVQILQCVLHPYSMALIHKGVAGTVTVQGLSVDSPGSFPSASGPNDLSNLIAKTLPMILKQMTAVPILFDLFRLVPHTWRGTPDEGALLCNNNWMTLVQPIKVPSDQNQPTLECSQSS